MQKKEKGVFYHTLSLINFPETMEILQEAINQIKIDQYNCDNKTPEGFCGGHSLDKPPRAIYNALHIPNTKKTQ